MGIYDNLWYAVGKNEFHLIFVNHFPKKPLSACFSALI